MIDFSIVPLMAILVSAAFGAVSIAWDSDRRATRSMGAVFLCTGSSALLDLLTYMESDPERALAWMRWVHVGPLLTGPAALWVVAQMLPQSRARLERNARLTAAVCLAVGVGMGFVPGATEAMIPTSWGGWMPVWGLGSIVIIPCGFLVPLYAGYEATRTRPRDTHRRTDGRRVSGLRVSIVCSILISMPTEYLLPLLGIPVPRLGALGVSVAAALVWLAVLHDTDELILTPQGVARTLLARLHDGVVLIQLDGMILSSNLRFGELSGRTGAELLGVPLARLVDAPIDQISAGVEDRESTLRTPDGAAIPVSLSSSIARSRVGTPIGVVVVFRDRREIDALRSQLLTSGRLAAIGQLAAGIAHEVNNPVAFVRSDLNLLAQRIEEIRDHVASSPGYEEGAYLFEHAKRRVEQAQEGIARVAEVVVDVREFAHVGGSGQGGSDPEAVVEGAMRLARLQRGEEVALRVAEVDGADRIDSGQELKQILLAILCVLVECAEKGARIEADVRTDGSMLSIGLFGGPFVGSADAVQARLEALGGGVLEGDASELGLAMAAELIAQLGGGLRIDANGAQALRIEVTVPCQAQETRP